MNSISLVPGIRLALQNSEFKILLLTITMSSISGTIPSLLTILAGMTPLPDQQLWKTSTLVPKLEEAASWVKSFVPPEFDEYLQLPAEPEPAT